MEIYKEEVVVVADGIRLQCKSLEIKSETKELIVKIDNISIKTKYWKYDPCVNEVTLIDNIDIYVIKQYLIAKNVLIEMQLLGKLLYNCLERTYYYVPSKAIIDLFEKDKVIIGGWNYVRLASVDLQNEYEELINKHKILNEKLNSALNKGRLNISYSTDGYITISN